jgi:hypothetical protein
MYVKEGSLRVNLFTAKTFKKNAFTVPFFVVEFISSYVKQKQPNTDIKYSNHYL